MSDIEQREGPVVFLAGRSLATSRNRSGVGVSPGVALLTITGTVTAAAAVEAYLMRGAAPQVSA